MNRERKMARKMTSVIILVSMMTLSLAQTFQYSRGWTNGKRGGHPSQVLSGLPGDFGSSSSGGQVAVNQMVDLPTPCQLQKLKMLLRGAAGTEELYLLPCEVIGTSGVVPIPDFTPVGRFRHSSTSQENNNNY